MSVTASYPLGLCGAVAGMHSLSGRVNGHRCSLVCMVVVCALVLAAVAGVSLAEQATPAPPATNQVEQVSAQELLRVYQQLQEQLRTTQAAIEQARQEARTAAAQNAEALAKGLQAVQEGFVTQRAQDWAAMQRSNQIMLMIVGAFAVLSFLTMLILTYFQWRMSKGLADISAALPTALGLRAVPEMAALGPAESSGLHLSEGTGPTNGVPDGAAPNPHAAATRARELNLPAGSRLFLDDGAGSPRPRIKALRTAVIVGLICAAVLALVFYIVTCEKLGFGPLRAVLKI